MRILLTISALAGLALTAAAGAQAAVPQAPVVVDMSRFNPKTLPGPQPATRTQVCLNGEWEFCPLYDREALTSDELVKLPPQPADGWGTIRVPGKWKQVSGNEAVDAFGYPREWTKANRGWYRRTFAAPDLSAGQRLKLKFGGVLVYCEILVNGQSVGRHLGGVTPFEVDITDAAQPGAGNALAVYVVNEQAAYINRPKSRYDYTARGPIYYSYGQGSAGIWQDVFLVTCPQVYVDSVAVRTSYRRKQIGVAAELRNEGSRDLSVVVAATAETLDGKPVRDLGRVEATVRAAPPIPPGVGGDRGGRSATHVNLQAAWPDARLWSPEDPHLYRLHTRVFAGDALVDEHYQRFGFREFWIEGQKFILNGRKITLFGDWTGKYAAGKDACLRPEYARADIKHLKGMNYCGTRLQTIGTAPAMLEACDELGLPLIATGISDSAGFFDPDHVDEAMANAKADMLAWVKRDRNHPSVLIWSTENEDQPPSRTPEVLERYKEIDRVFLENDPTRPFVHNGAAVTFARSDVDGWSPILCPHYVTGDRSFGERLDALKEWRDNFSKPLILGEEDVAVSERPGGNLVRLLGDRLFGDVAERDALWGWYIRRMVGAWRTYGVGGIIAHSNHFPVANAPLYSHFTEAWGFGPAGAKQLNSRPLLEFQWDDLATPYAKPKYHLGSGLDYVNPWLPSVPESKPTPVYAATREAFSPVMVTLARSLAHNYFAAEECAKDVYLINEGPSALPDCTLAWELRSIGPPYPPNPGGDRGGRGERRLSLDQGAIQRESIRLRMPDRPGTLVLTVTLSDSRGKRLAGDELALSVYAPIPPAPFPGLQPRPQPPGKGETAAPADGIQARPQSPGKGETAALNHGIQPPVKGETAAPADGIQARPQSPGKGETAARGPATPPAPRADEARVVLFDPAGGAPTPPPTPTPTRPRTARALEILGVDCERLDEIGDVKALAPGDLLVIGAGAATPEVVEAEPLLKAFLARGGKVLVFEQTMADRNPRSFAFVRAPTHPAFRGLQSPYLSMWRTPSHNLSLGTLRVAGTARTTVLVDLAYSAALAESRFGSGTLVMSGLELVEGCLQGEPEARIITANLINYLSAAGRRGTEDGAPDEHGQPVSRLRSPVSVRYLGGEVTRAFLQDGMRMEGLQPWRREERLAPCDLVVVGEDAVPPQTAADKEQVARFVSEGGNVLTVGTPGAALAAWLPEPVDVARVPAAYLLKKKSADSLIDGVGPLFIMRSERAANYFVADPIPGLQHGFKPRAGSGWQSLYRLCDRENEEYTGLWRRSYYWESEADAAASLKHGRGSYILTSLPMQENNSVTVDFLSAVLANLGAPSADTRCFLPFSALAGAAGAPKATSRDWRKGFVPVNLVAYGNRLFHDEVAGDGFGGWDDSGENDLRNLPSGDYLFGGTPFHIIDPQRDDPNEDIRNRLGHPIRPCIVLKGAARPQFPERVAGIQVGEKLRRLAFLHTATWCSGPEGQPVARYVVRYADGTTAELLLRKGVHLDDWTRVSRGNLKDATVAWTGSNNVHRRVGLYVTSWTNPHPEKEIAEIDFISEGTAIPVLVAITGQR